MAGSWSDRRVVVTGGRGFLGRAVQAVLDERGATSVATPSSADYDLRDRGAVARMFADLEPEVVLHLAARVGGIGANQARPADLYLDNLLMGTYVIDEARLRTTPKVVVVGTICSYPKHTPVPFQESSLWQGYPEETNAPYGIAKLAQLVQLQSNRAQYGQNGIYVMPTNLYGPGDKFHPAVSHVIPALIKKSVDAVDAGADAIEVWGTGSASREFLYVDDAAEGIVLAAERYDGPEPVNLGANREMPIKELVDLVVELTGFKGEVRWDTSKPDGQPRRCVDPGRARSLFGFEARTGFREGLQRTIDWYRSHREEAEARAALPLPPAVNRPGHRVRNRAPCAEACPGGPFPRTEPVLAQGPEAASGP
jgi:GDP-L-fucose synthase